MRALSPRFLLLISSLILACSSSEEMPAPPAVGEGDGRLFRDATSESGIDFVHVNGMRGELYMVEMVGAGAALFDYDNDGDLDLYLVQGGALGGGGSQLDRLYRNELEAGNLRFVDATSATELAAAGYGQGVAVADYDNDGWLDLYLSNYGSNQLWRNDGDGTFSDQSAAAGVDDSGWGTSSTFLDYDRDGWLDLYVANYLDASLENHFNCTSATGTVDYCGPRSYEPAQDRLYRNRGDGGFEDRTAAAGLLRPGAGLGVVAADLDGDGWLDLYVANDQMENFFWRNRADGTFEERALMAGCAVSGEGRAEASMGVDAADFDDDGDLDLFLTHLRNETNTLYRNDGSGTFTDATTGTGLGPPSLPFTSFGTLGFDYDSDGRLDLMVASGTVRRLEEQMRRGDPHPLKQANQLFHNQGGARFEVVEDVRVPSLAIPRVSRGAAFGDVDNDGDPDAVITTNNGAPQLLLNESRAAAWIGLRLVIGEPSRDALGALVELRLRGGSRLVRRVHTDGSFLCAHDARVHFGLSARGEVREVAVRWPDGGWERFPAPPTGRYTTLARGGGESDTTQGEGS